MIESKTSASQLTDTLFTEQNYMTQPNEQRLHEKCKNTTIDQDFVDFLKQSKPIPIG